MVFSFFESKRELSELLDKQSFEDFGKKGLAQGELDNNLVHK